MASERTEAPTPKRLHDARQKGNVSRSQELVSAGALLAALIGLRLAGPGIWEDLAVIMREGLQQPVNEELTPSSALGLGQHAAAQGMLALAPLLAIVVLAGVVLNVAQTGLVLSGAGLSPKFSRVNPAAGMKRLLGMDGLVNLGKAVAKMAIVAVVVWMTMSAQLAEIAALGQLSIGAATARAAQFSFDVGLRAAIVLLVLAALDYGWQRRRYLQQLRMTKEEVRQELKESDGDPQIKAAIRRRRQSLLNRMIAAVPKADVVVTNPTHYAVALQYDPLAMGAPIVIAKGERLVAQRIKEVARKAGVPVLEEPPLARALYAAVPIGHPVPANLYRAVAEVLAWVYSLRARTRRAPAWQGAK
ncbi:MAG: flagellar biosynthesis protein FlhB [Chloroflexi bacterium]|nr:flagellar biosynthesis protein FlhB [Chloroflexota bacterium]